MSICFAVDQRIEPHKRQRISEDEDTVPRHADKPMHRFAVSNLVVAAPPGVQLRGRNRFLTG
jgi:hypothetical protein